MKGDKLLKPSIEVILDDMRGATVFTKLDVFFQYFQIRLTKHVEEVTTFNCKHGAFQFSVIPFGLMNATPIFQWMATELRGDLDFVTIYIDDVAINGN